MQLTGNLPMYSSHSAVSREIKSPLNSVLSVPISKNSEHAHVQCLVESSRAREQIHLASIVQQVADQSRFVDIIKSFAPDLLKDFDAHRQMQSLHSAASLSAGYHRYTISLHGIPYSSWIEATAFILPQSCSHSKAMPQR